MIDYIFNGAIQIFRKFAQRLKLDGIITDPDVDQEEELSSKETEPFQDSYWTKTKPEGH